MQSTQTEFPPASAEADQPPVAMLPAETLHENGSSGVDAAGVLLPIVIHVRGEIVSSNFELFASAVRIRLAEINRNLESDEDFLQAATDAKAIERAEQSLMTAKEKALSDAQQLHALFGQIDSLSEELASARLSLGAQIKERKEELRQAVIAAALAEFDAIDAPDAKEVFRRGIEEALKGRRTVSAMKKAVMVVVTINLATIKRNREKIATFEKSHGTTLTLDRRVLELKSPDSVEVELRRRIDLMRAEVEMEALAAEAASARAETTAAKYQLEEAGKPPSSPPADEEGAEWLKFESAFGAALAPVKAARSALRNPVNILRAKVLADAINSAWNKR